MNAWEIFEKRLGEPKSDRLYEDAGGYAKCKLTAEGERVWKDMTATCARLYHDTNMTEDEICAEMIEQFPDLHPAEIAGYIVLGD